VSLAIRQKSLTPTARSRFQVGRLWRAGKRFCRRTIRCGLRVSRKKDDSASDKIIMPIVAVLNNRILFYQFPLLAT
jgi:hypothetical protein